MTGMPSPIRSVHYYRSWDLSMNEAFTSGKLTIQVARAKGCGLGYQLYGPMEVPTAPHCCEGDIVQVHVMAWKGDYRNEANCYIMEVSIINPHVTPETPPPN